MSVVAHFFMSVGGSEIHERLAHFFIDFYIHIGFDEVRAFKKRFGKFIRQSQWKDTDVVVYMR